MPRFLVSYFCTFTRKQYTYAVSASDAQEAVDKCRTANEAGSVPIRVIEVSQVVTDWE